jgi:hypothetical protein
MPGFCCSGAAAAPGSVAEISLIELDADTCEAASVIAEVTGVRTLDALHLAAAQRAGGSSLPLLAFDLRQAQALRGGHVAIPLDLTPAIRHAGRRDRRLRPLLPRRPLA